VLFPTSRLQRSPSTNRFYRMADFDREDWVIEVARGNQDHRRIDRSPDEAHKLKPWTVVALILNRTIGTKMSPSKNLYLEGY
jgi:hypothetical protein